MAVIMKEGSMDHAALFSLIVYCENAERLSYCQKFVKAIVQYFPARVIFIMRLPLERREEFSTKQESIPSLASPDGYCEQLTIELSDDKRYQAPFWVFPFLLPQVPLLLFWDCDPTTEMVILPKFIRYAQRLLFDSDSIKNLAPFANRWLQKKHMPNRVDLNWARIMGWRDVMSKVFDTEERLSQLVNAQEITIVYNANEGEGFFHNQTEAIYLQAWLATQLHWTYEKGYVNHKNSCFVYRTALRQVHVELKPMQMDVTGAGLIAEVNVKGYEGGLFQMKRAQLGPQIEVRFLGDQSCTLPFHLSLKATHLSRYFLQQLLYRPEEKEYAAMLQTIAQQKE